MHNLLPDRLAPAVILDEIRDFCFVLHDAFESGCQWTVDQFADWEKPIEKSVAAPLVRWCVRNHLCEANHQVQDVEIQNVSNIGLGVVHRGYLIRIFKSAKGLPPAPGWSRRKRDFYTRNQQLLLPIESPKSEEAACDKPNLVILWEVDSSYLHKRLILALPREAELGKSVVDVYWAQEIPHPATLMTTSNQFEGVTEQFQSELLGEDPQMIEIDTEFPSEELSTAEEERSSKDGSLDE